jgi:hypothetical protein
MFHGKHYERENMRTVYTLKNTFDFREDKTRPYMFNAMAIFHNLEEAEKEFLSLPAELKATLDTIEAGTEHEFHVVQVHSYLYGRYKAKGRARLELLLKSVDTLFPPATSANHYTSVEELLENLKEEGE